MSPIMSLATITLVSCIVLSLVPQTPAAYGPLNYACCVKYTRNPLPFGLIKGFIMQSSREVCRIDAIIFFTKHKKVCASAEDEWVRAALSRLKARINKLALSGSHQHHISVGMNSTIHTSTSTSTSSP
ncbi:C-C motif chemokine 20 [Xyrauchen texanus]|uniref:C-C motif chemokine 20 n=1 Tax=Xyrauchen texanus TaxID=154827 RepID=UPI00224245FE|nr:C-C motif chemokine 20 [Xyrauchen texanus]